MSALLTPRLALLALLVGLGCAEADFDPPKQCEDGLDNDGDGFVDTDDPGCGNAVDDDETNGAFCGDGEINNFEECDGANLGGESCEGLGLGQGSLVCTPGCVFGTAGCVNAACSDGTDNDQDGFLDTQDPGCSSGADTEEDVFASDCRGVGGEIFDVTFADTSFDIVVPGSTEGIGDSFAPKDTTNCRQATGGEVVIFYKVVAFSTVRFSLNRAATNYDTVLYVRRGDCATGGEVCNDDISSTNTRSELTLNLPPDNYFIFVDGFDGQGSFELLIDLSN
jgi:hypothetical protein